MMFLPRNGKARMFLGKERGSGASTPGTSTPPSLLPRALLASSAGPCGEEDTLQGWPGWHGALAHLCTPLQSTQPYTFPNSPTALHTHAGTLTGVLRNTFTCPHLVAEYSSLFIGTHVTNGSEVPAP